MNTAAIYCRVSTEEQRRHGISLDAQESRMWQYAEALGLDIVHVGIEGLSAKDTDRPELQTIMGMVSKKRIQHLLIIKLDRLSRETTDALLLAKELCKKGVGLHLVSEGGLIDFSDPSQEMLFTMRAAMAQFERKRIALNTKFALARKREKSERISGEAPFGYQFNDGKIVENPTEQRIISRIQLLKDNGCSIRAIQQKLSDEGLFNRRNKTIGVCEIWKILKAA